MLGRKVEQLVKIDTVQELELIFLRTPVACQLAAVGPVTCSLVSTTAVLTTLGGLGLMMSLTTRPSSVSYVRVACVTLVVVRSRVVTVVELL